MALTYSLIFSTGIVSAQTFTLPRDGRKVQFTANDNSMTFKKIFIYIDGKITPFQNCSRMNTPVGMLGSSFSAPHDSLVITVDSRAHYIPEITVPITPVPVMLSHGKQAVIRYSGKIKASIAVNDPETVAEAYIHAGISPEKTAEEALKEALRNAVVTELQETTKNDAIHAINTADSLSIKLGQIIRYNVERRLPWCTLNTCEVNLTIENVDHLVEETNEPVIFTIETKKVLLKAILATFGTTPLSPEVASIIKEYVISNPGISTADLIKFCKDVKSLYPTTNVEDIYSAFSLIGGPTLKLPGGN